MSTSNVFLAYLKKIYADYRNFQRDQVLWFRFAEGSFDSFMQRQKL